MIQKIIAEYQNEWNDYRPVVRATLFHGEFVKVHPFIDGNGRTSRLLLNFELMKNVYTPIIIKIEDRAKYYDALGFETDETADSPAVIFFNTTGTKFELYPLTLLAEDINPNNPQQLAAAQAIKNLLVKSKLNNK